MSLLIFYPLSPRQKIQEYFSIFTTWHMIFLWNRCTVPLFSMVLLCTCGRHLTCFISAIRSSHGLLCLLDFFYARRLYLKFMAIKNGGCLSPCGFLLMRCRMELSL